MPLLEFVRDHYGRRYVNIGRGVFCMGFGPVALIERIWWRGKLIYWNENALREGQRRRQAMGLDQGE